METTARSCAPLPDEPISLLAATDWNEEWKRLQRIRRKADDAQFWNKRSKNFDSKDAPSPYVRAFLDLIDVTPGSSVLDMGCGTGSLAVPLARAGNRVIAADFSRGMLEEAARRIEATGAKGIETKLLAWDDDWDAAGLGEDAVDVAFASRSIATADLAAALAKLTRTARMRCAATLTLGSSPRMDARVLAACGVRNFHGSDFQYAWNILFNAGFAPTAAYIDSQRKDTYDSREEARADFDRMLTDVIDPRRTGELARARAKLEDWLDAELVPNPTAGRLNEKGRAEGRLAIAHPRTIRWGFLSWDPRSTR